MELFSCLQELTQTPGVTGDELKNATAIVEKYFAPYVHQLTKDSMGNVIAHKKGSGRSPRKPKLAFTAHLDEIGLMVTKIEKGGFLRFTTLGGFDPRTLYGQQVEIHGKQPLTGIIGPKPPHIITEEERKKEIKIEELFIDTAHSEKEIKNNISPGNFVSLKSKLRKLADDKIIAGKALDNRAGIAALMECAWELTKLRHTPDVYFIATVQEEIGARGALVSTYSLSPEMGIAVDVCHGDTPGAPTGDTFELGKGPALGWGPNFHPVVTEKLKKTATNNYFPFKWEVAPGPTPTDAGKMQLVKEGVPCGLISIPLRYMHTSVEVIHMQDIKTAGKLLAQLAVNVDYHLGDELHCY